jgi:uncharacterized protein Yka (UPF0111/DUF47 family)
MKFSSIFPSDDKFYSFLDQQAACASACALHLKDFMKSADESGRMRAAAEIDAQRAKAKALVGEITSELCRSFITPFDREDIQDFADIMYKIPKIIEKIKDRVLMHGISTSDGDFIPQVDLIVQESAVTERLVKALTSGKGSKGVIACVEELRDLEQKGDVVRNELLVSLFKSDRDIRDIILQRDIYDMLEKVVDRFRDAAGVALQIVLKHS